MYYNILIEKRFRHPTSINKWSEIYDLQFIDWSVTFRLPFMMSRETAIQSLQYKILHRIIACNKWLYNIRIKDSPNCNYCDSVDTIQHFFLNCNNDKTFWNVRNRLISY